MLTHSLLQTPYRIIEIKNNWNIITDFVNLSTITQIESIFPKVLERQTTKFIEILSNFHCEICIIEVSLQPSVVHSSFGGKSET